MNTNPTPILLLCVVTGSILTAGLDAQRRQKSQAQLRQQRTEKLKKPFLTAAPWILDYDEARAAAKKQKKMLLTYFTRSYSP